jgi:hypothetical protein
MFRAIAMMAFSVSSFGNENNLPNLKELECIINSDEIGPYDCPDLYLDALSYYHSITGDADMSRQLALVDYNDCRYGSAWC